MSVLERQREFSASSCAIGWSRRRVVRLVLGNRSSFARAGAAGAL